MNKETFVYYLQTLYNLHHIPLSYGVNDDILCRFEPFSLGSEKSEWVFMNEKLHQRINSRRDSSDIMYYIYPNMVFLGLVKKNCEEGVEYVFIGPAVSINSRDEDIQEYLFRSGLTANDSKRLMQFFHANKMLSLDLFLNLLANINAALNGTIVTPDQFSDLSDRTTIKNYPPPDYHDDRELTYMETVARDDYLNKILYAVQNGQTDSLVELWANLGGIPMGDKAPFNGTLSDCRNNGIGTVFMLYQLAQQQGIGSEQLEDIKNFYVNRLSRIRSFDEFSSTIYEALLAFTQRIKDNTDFVTKNPVLNRVIRYIRSNITEKLTAEQIAADMNISVGYIFAKFRSELNTTFSRFLLEEKIKKATQLLLLTDKPLVEISNYLSFSSQSYFQKSFKKISGLTPTEYRLEQGKV